MEAFTEQRKIKAAGHCKHAEFFVSRPAIVEIIPPLKLSLSCRERPLLRRMNKLQKTFIALITLATVGLDPLFARIESRCRHHGGATPTEPKLKHNDDKLCTGEVAHASGRAGQSL